jgi:two-component system, sensor histidine kinase and response regulator
MRMDAADRAELEHLRLVARASGLVTWSLDLGTGKVTFTGVKESLGYDDAEIPAKLAAALELLVASADRARVLHEVQAYANSDTEAYESAYRMLHKDGSQRWMLARGSAERDAAGRALRMSGTSVDVTRLKNIEETATGTSVDVTRLKRAEETATQAVEQLRLATELSGVATWNFDLSGGDLESSTSSRLTGIWEPLGYDPARAPSDYLSALKLAVAAEDQDRIIALMRACVEGETDRFDAEYRVRHQDGSLKWKLARGLVVREPSGRPLRFTGISIDISRLKQAEDDARRAVQQQRLATDLSGVGVWGYELVNGDLATATSAFAIDGVMSSLGYEADEVAPTLPARLGAVVYPEDQPLMQQMLQDYFLGKTQRFEAECRFVHKNGSVVWRLVRGIATRDAAGIPLTFMGSAVDVTQLKHTQAELQRLKNRLEVAITGSKACTWDFALTAGQIAGSQPEFTNAWELCGYDVPDDPQLVGQAFAVVIPPDEVGPFLQKIQAFLDGTEREWESPLRIAHADGIERCHLSRGVVQRDANGVATRFTGASIDITDRMRAEKALQESEERFRRTFENAAVGMTLTDLDGRFLEYNARFCEFLGYEREELVGRKFVDFMLRDEVDGDLERQRGVVRGDIPWFTRDKRYIRKDGVIVWGNITVTVIQRRPDGTPVHVMGILQDITERKALEVEVTKARARMELAMRGSNVAVFEGDFSSGGVEDSKWELFNLWESMGFDGATASNDFASISKYSIHADDRPAVLARFGELVETRSPNWYMEHRFCHRDGSVGWRLSRGTLVFGEDGALKTFIGTWTDITELKRIEVELQRAREAAESASRAKDEFLANVSHEIRTPMNAILGMTELALDSAPSEHQRQLLSTVRSAARNLLTIINDLLDFSKIESGKLTLDCTDFSLRSTVGDTLRALAVRAHRKGLELLCHVRPDVPDALDGDAGRLRQVLMNLVGNAIKFTPQGEVEVDVALEAAMDGAVSLVFTVRDTGIGIARDKQQAIFIAFEQEDSSTTRRYGGTGLGLTISAQLAQLMGGNITVQSAPGCGSTFRFTARFARSKRPDATTLSPERLANLKVLVVDDNETNRRILVEWLSSWRMEPTSAGNATEALAAVASAHAAGAPFSLVLLDAHMPDIDGVTLAREIRQRWQARAPRLILLSSDDTASLSALARDNGVLAYLIKPVQQSELLETIWAVINLDVTAPESSSATDRQPARARRLRVLVAEDNELNVTLLRELLQQRGHSAQFARDGHAALELALHGAFDLMLLDLHMPGLDGFDVVRAVREHERETNDHLRIIALTARSSARDRERCLAAGMDEFLAKPIEAAALWATMGKLMADSPAVQGPQVIERGLLDPRAILRACAGDASVLEKLIAVFRRTMPALMSRIRSALARGDLPELREVAHQLVATVGAFSTVTADVALTLEDAAIREETESCVALVDRLGSLCSALLDATMTLTIDSVSL